MIDKEAREAITILTNLVQILRGLIDDAVNTAQVADITLADMINKLDKRLERGGL